MQNEQQIYGRNDMIMLEKHKKIYGSLGLTEQFVFDTIQGEGMVVLNNPKKGMFEKVVTNLTLQGNTKQDSTTGKNVVFVPDIEAGSELQNIPCLLENGVYISCHENTAKVSKNVWRIRIEYKDGSLKYLTDSQMETGSEFTCSTENPIIAIRPRGINIESGAYRKIQVEYGSAKMNYEPYTGGKPSPSPDYPQEIKNVGKWNEETQKYEVDVILNGGNLWNKDSVIRGHIDNNTGETVQHETDVSFVYTVIVPIDGKYTVRVEEENAYGSYFTAVFNDEYYNPYIRISPGSKGILTLKKGKNKIQVAGLDSMNNKHSEKITLFYGDNEPSTYESYREPQILTLTSDRPITKWDKLVEQDGQIGWLYGSRRYILTGNEVFESRDGYNIESYTNRFFILNDFLMENDALKPLAYMKCLRHKQYVYAPNIFEEGFETNKGQFHIKFLNERVGISTSDDNEVRTLKYSEYVKKMYKDGNPIEILYATKNKEFVPLPQSEQDVIRALLTYYPTTVVTVDGGELPVGIEVTYKQMNKG